MKDAPLRIFPYVAGARSRFSNLFYVDIIRIRHGSNSLVSGTKRVPRVSFHWGYDISYMDMRTIALYWTPRNPCSEGEYMYAHWIKFSWRKLFHFDWR